MFESVKFAVERGVELGKTEGVRKGTKLWLNENAQIGAIGMVTALGAVLIGLYVIAIVVGSMGTQITQGNIVLSTKKTVGNLGSCNHQKSNLRLCGRWNTTMSTLDQNAASAFNIAKFCHAIRNRLSYLFTPPVDFLSRCMPYFVAGREHHPNRHISPCDVHVIGESWGWGLRGLVLQRASAPLNVHRKATLFSMALARSWCIRLPVIPVIQDTHGDTNYAGGIVPSRRGGAIEGLVWQCNLTKVLS